MPETPDETIRKLPYDQKPYWDIERARAGNTREVPVEIVVNGKAVAKKNVLADGKVRDIELEIPVSESSWIAARILPAAHTNPGVRHRWRQTGASIPKKRPMVSGRSESVLDAKAPRMKAADLVEGRQAYDHARDVYRKLIGESEHE